MLCSNSQSALFSPQTKSDVFPVAQEVKDEEVSTPRSKIRRSIYGFSPSKQKPASDLDLSDDTQPDITKKAETYLAHQQDVSVIVVDALSQRVSDDVAEVSVTERLEVSPHKVICHSPRAAKLSLRGSGDTHQAAGVHVKQLHSVALGSLTKSKKLAPQAEQNSPDRIDNTSHDASSSNPSTGAELGDEVPHSLQDISQELEKMKSQKAVKATRKKKVGREVPSRLMETTAAHRAKSTNQSYLQQSTRQLSSRRVVTSHKPQYLNEKVKSSQTGKKSQRASTPEKENIVPDESFDVSALQVDKTTMSRDINETVSFLAPPRADLKGKSSTSSRPKVKSSTKKKTSPENITQDILDINYSRYIQWLFLASKAEKSLETEEKDVMNQLQKLWVTNHNMRQKLSSLEQEHDRLQHIVDLEEHLDLQKSALGPLVHELPQLHQNYESMALALDSTRHELQTDGINIPDTKQEQEELEDALMNALDESEQLVAAIASQTRRTVSTTSQYAQTVDTLAKSATEEQKMLNKCKTLVKAAQTLANQDNSMKIQEIEIKRSQQ